jgi:diaminopimelate decarboxylase
LTDAEVLQMTVLPDLRADLVAAYGTPLYIYDLAAARRAVHALRDALPQAVEVHYSAKANPHPLLIAELARMGLRVEVSSDGELAAAIAAGVRRDRILYTGPAKTRTELAGAIASGVRLFSVESQVDRDRLASTAPDEDLAYLVRLVSPGGNGAVGIRMTGTPSQFGTDAGALTPDSAILRRSGGAQPVGFHIFSASNVKDEAALVQEFAASIEVASATAARTGFTPRIVDIGGGFAAPYAAPGDLPRYTDLRDAIGRALDDGLPGWREGQPAVTVESGRHLAATTGTLLTTVMDIKPSGRDTYLLCDAGINALGGMYGLGRLVVPKAQPEGQPADGEAMVLAGPLCTPLDVLSRNAHMKQPAVGDVLAIPNVGAYGLTASLIAFLSRSVAAEVVVDGSTVVGARQLRLIETALQPVQKAVDERA